MISPTAILRPFAALAAVLCLPALAGAQTIANPLPLVGAEDQPVDLTDLSLEELMNIEVTVASKTKQKLADIPAAVYVLTGDEIRRSGFSSVQEALRMVPGFQVSHWTNNMWDVTARGYGNGTSLTNSAFLNQLLVMIDGVPVYSPQFAGVWWALQDIDLDDIDRIEIIRGPGGIIWGANAEHGVVHIITKKSADTQGAKIGTWQGTEDRHGSVRAGIPFGETGHLRAWGKISTYDTPSNPFGGYYQDWTMNTGGFRADWGDPEGWEYNVWARAYRGRFRNIGFDLVFFQPFSSLNEKSGGQLSGSAHNNATGETWTGWFQKDQQDIQTHVQIDIEQFDIEYQRELAVSDSTTLNYGAGVRRINSDIFGEDPFFLSFSPQRQRQNNLRAHVVSTTNFTEQNASLVLGVQLEDNEFTGLQVQPSIRGTWRANEDTLFWAGVSRAVRTPSLEEVALDGNSFFIGDPNFKSEELLSYEFGSRWQPSARASFDLALYYNDMSHLHNRTSLPSGQFQLGNDAKGRAAGAELAVDLKPTSKWSIRSAYTRSRLDLDATNGANPVFTQKYTASELINIRSYYNITDRWEFDLAVYKVGGLAKPFDIASYIRGDVRLGYNPSDAVQIAVGVQSFADPAHSEFDSFDNPRRQAYVSLTWQPGRRKTDSK